MKKFELPEIEVINFKVMDILTDSGDPDDYEFTFAPGTACMS